MRASLASHYCTTYGVDYVPTTVPPVLQTTQAGPARYAVPMTTTGPGRFPPSVSHSASSTRLEASTSYSTDYPPPSSSPPPPLPLAVSLEPSGYSLNNMDRVGSSAYGSADIPRLPSSSSPTGPNSHFVTTSAAVYTPPSLSPHDAEVQLDAAVAAAGGGLAKRPSGYTLNAESHVYVANGVEGKSEYADRFAPSALSPRRHGKGEQQEEQQQPVGLASVVFGPTERGASAFARAVSSRPPFLQARDDDGDDDDVHSQARAADARAGQQVGQVGVGGGSVVDPIDAAVAAAAHRARGRTAVSGIGPPMQGFEGPGEWGTEYGDKFDTKMDKFVAASASDYALSHGLKK